MKLVRRILIEFLIIEAIWGFIVPRPCPTVRVQFGRVKYKQKGRFARYICTPGYVIAGHKNNYCEKGEWINTIPKCVRGTCQKANPPANGRIYPSLNGGVLNFYCKSNFQLKGPTITYCNGTHWDNTLPTCLPTNTTPPLSCDFEDNLCGWNHDLNHDFDWIRHHNATPSASIGTGPSFDHTKGSGKDGYYMYIESSAKNKGDTAHLLSPIYDQSTPNEQICFEFFYHMYGLTTGDLRVFLKKFNDTWNFNEQTAIFNKRGNQGNYWYRGFLKLGNINDSFQVIIEGVRGSSYSSDIAIDDVRLIRNCTAEDEIQETTSTEISISSSAMTVESCANRCNLTDTRHINYLVTCDCNEGCYDTNRCCPDYWEFCVNNITDDSGDVTTGGVETTTIGLTTTKAATQFVTSKTKPSTKPPPLTSFTIKSPTTLIRKFPTVTTTSLIPTIKTNPIYVKPNDNSDVEDVPPADSDESYSRDIADKDADVLSDYVEKDEEARHQKIIISENKISESNTKTIIFGVGVVFGVLFAASGMAFVAKRYQWCQCRSLKRFSHSSNGDSQSDVRFLTSDEILDLNLPCNYDSL